MPQEIYLDNSATTKPYDEVLDYMHEVSRLYYGNPSSLHTKGIEAENLLKQARSQIAETLAVDPKDILFTSGGTEANNLAILGCLYGNPRLGKHIITSEIEHPSVLEVYKYLATNGFRVDYIRVNSNGTLDIDDLKSKLDDDTSLVSLIHTNNEVGAVLDIGAVKNAMIERSPKAVLHIDAVQTYGKTLLRPVDSSIDLLSFSSHKIHGPKGVGALYVRKGLRLKPLLIGGGQELNIRSGTENVPGICGFGLAAQIIHSDLNKNYEHVLALKQHFERSIIEEFPDALINSYEHASPYIINISFANLKAEVLLHHLEQKGIFVSTGSACSSKKNHHSHVLKAMGVNPKMIDGAIRFSLCASNTFEEIDETISALKEIIPVISIKKKR